MQASTRREFVISTLAGIVAGSATGRLRAQSPVAPDLADLAGRNAFQLINRSATTLVDGARRGVRLSVGPGEGMAFLPGVEFANGVIECDLRGKDTPQQSFIGVAFHALNGTATDAIYFRPFNFRSQDPSSRVHAVQYHSTPNFGWQRLRAEHPDEYEKAVMPVPDPNGWFHARIEVASPRVSVFVNYAKEPTLVVNQLSDRQHGNVGLWVGNNSGGDFANLRITPA